MKSFFLAIGVLCVLAFPAQGQEPSLIEKIRQIEAGNAALGQRVNALEESRRNDQLEIARIRSDVWGISAKVDKLTPTVQGLPMGPSFQVCNPVTGQCSPGLAGAYYAAPGDSGACGSSGGFLNRIRERRAARRGY